MRKILIIETAFIGDLILSTSIAEKLHRTYPEAIIDMVVRKGAESLLKDHPFIRQVLPFNKKRKLSSVNSITRQVRKEGYDLLINTHRHFSTGLISALSGAKTVSGFKENPFSFSYNYKAKRNSRAEKPVHETDRLFTLIAPFVKGEKENPKLYPSKADIEKAVKHTGERFITIHPSSVWYTKRLPPEKWVGFMDQLSSGIKVYLLGAPAEKQYCEEIKRGSTHKNTEVLAGELNLLQTAALLPYAAMNYSNDSAPLHLASAVNAPVCAIFVSTAPVFGYTPLSEISHIVEPGEKLNCRPCGVHGHQKCPEGHFRCGKLINPDQLLEVLPS